MALFLKKKKKSEETKKFNETKSFIEDSDILYIRSRLNGLYLDVKGESKKDNTSVIVWPFHGGSNQQWVYKNNRYVVSMCSGKAVDIYESPLGLKQLVIRSLSPGKVSQMFTYNPDTLTFHSELYPDMCLEVKNANTSKGTTIVIQPIKPQKAKKVSSFVRPSANSEKGTFTKSNSLSEISHRDGASVESPTTVTSPNSAQTVTSPNSAEAVTPFSAQAVTPFNPETFGQNEKLQFNRIRHGSVFATTCPDNDEDIISDNTASQKWELITKKDVDSAPLDAFYASAHKLGGYNQSQCLYLKEQSTEEGINEKEEDTGEDTMKLKRDKKIFFKPHSSERTLLLECGGSNLTNYITGGLVPISYRARFDGTNGIYQKFFPLNDKPFKPPQLKADRRYVVDLTFLNQQQLNQLFVHMVADRLISNWDTHNEQFAIDSNNQNVISFDKEKCFYLFTLTNVSLKSGLNLNEDYRRLDFTKNLWKNPMLMATSHNLYFIYSSLAIGILNGTLNIDYKGKEVQDMFSRCEKIPYDLVKECFDDYALIEYCNSSYRKEFLSIIYNRIRNIRKPVHHYFGWDGCPETAPHDPWMLDKP